MQHKKAVKKKIQNDGKGKLRDDSHAVFQCQEQPIQIGIEKQKVLGGITIGGKMKQMGLNVWNTVLTSM